MIEKKPATPSQMLLLGAVFSAIGFYFILVGAGTLPVPGGTHNLHGPLWVVLCVGLAFFLAGVSVLLQYAGHADSNGELPATAPPWMRFVQYGIGVVLFGCFAVIGSWVAFGPGERHFSGSFLFFSERVNDGIGRAAFGFGAILCWLATLGFAVFGARKLLRRN